MLRVNIIVDRETNRSKGFAYAEFGSIEGLKKALQYNGGDLLGRSVNLDLATSDRTS